MGVGEKIKLLRKSLNLTQTELGERVGVKKNAVSKWECGRVEDIPTSTIKALAALFDVPPSYLIDDTGDIAASARLVSGQDDYPSNIISLPEMRKIPLLGTIACGKPILAEENIGEYIDIPKNIHADFALACQGDSMINARIFDGDVVYIKQQETVESGEIAAVLIDGEATLKRVRLFDDHIALEPENPMYKPFVYWGEEMNTIRILGKAVAFTSAIR